MNILIVVDKYGSAIWRLAESVRVNCPHFDIKVFPVHPKRNDIDTITEAQKLMMWADVIDVHYWKSGEVLRSSFPKEFNAKPRILFHFNPYDLDKQEWQKIYSRVVVGNNFMYETLPYSSLVPYGIDLFKFRFNELYTEDKTVHMAVARIESKKGVLEVARACKELGYKLLLIGRVSEPLYMNEVMQTKADIEFIEAADEENLVKSYSRAAIHVCNSTDGFESGTLPILESMASGVPVLTRNVGHVPDLYDGSNMVVRMGAKDDIEDLTKQMQALMENRDWRLKIREKAWDTVKNRDARRMARSISSIYYAVWQSIKPLVSVIIPTHSRPESLIECLVAIAEQDYSKIEVIVSDSGDTNIEEIVRAYQRKVSFPVKYIRFENKGYSLAEARNRAIIDAEGSILVFCDDRLAMEPQTIGKFAEQSHDNLWQWGVKDGAEKGFVENLSCCRRDNIVAGGMFCERIIWYGGMSQEVRTRFENKQSFVFELNKEARARSIRRTGSKASRRYDVVNSKFTIYKLYS